MCAIYLTNAFSPNMLSEYPKKIIIDKVDKDEFCSSIITGLQNGSLINAISRNNAARIINFICGTQLVRNNIRIKLDHGDTLLAVLLKEWVDEDETLSDEEIKQMYREGKIEFYKIIV